MPIRGCIFDLDGVLTDTAEYHYQGWQRLADELGIPFDRERNEALRGISRRRSLELLLAGRTYPEEQMLEMMERKNRYYQELLTRVTPQDLLPGARNVLDAARAAGMKIAIGSASKNAREVVQRLHIESCIDGLADGYSVVRPKPEPDLFIYAAGLLGVCVNNASSSRTPRLVWWQPGPPECMLWVLARWRVWARPISCSLISLA